MTLNGTEDFQNPRARIGFVIYYPFQFYVYKNIYRHLAAESEFIIDLMSPFSTAGEDDLHRRIIALLQKHGVHYRTIRREEYALTRYARSFFSKYQALVSVWEQGCMLQPCTDGIPKINTTYGAGKELTMVRPSRGIYDLILAYGSRDSKLFSMLTNVEIVGNPKFDDWFNHTLDTGLVDDLRKRLDRTKKTVLYLPTHSDLSSVDMLAGEFAALAKKHNVVAKLHYYMAGEEPERIARLHKDGVLLFDDSADLLPLLEVADVVVSDNSSAIFDAILADKPLVVADFWSEEFLDATHKEPLTFRRGMQGAVTYSQSIEQLVKRDGSVIALKKPADLGAAIAEALDDTDTRKARRAELREELFAFNDGACGERAAHAIRRSIDDRNLSKRPIIHHAFEAYKRRTGRLSYGRERVLERKLASYESALSDHTVTAESGIVFSIIMIGRGVQESEALRSLSFQAFPQERYEIILVGASGTGEKGSGTRMVEIPRGKTLAVGIAQALERAQGRFIVFTTSEYIQRSDLLASLYAAYRRFPAAGGVGGYSGPARDSISPADWCVYLRLADALGIEREPVFMRNLPEIEGTVPDTVPTGDFSNISYKKALLPVTPQNIDSPQQLALFLKLRIMADHSLVFTPLKSVRPAFSLSAFAHEECENEFFRRLEKDTIQRSWTYRPYTAFKLLADIWYLALRQRNLSLAVALFFVGIARFRGRAAASLLLMQRYAERMLQDGRRGLARRH